MHFNFHKPTKDIQEIGHIDTSNLFKQKSDSFKTLSRFTKVQPLEFCPPFFSPYVAYIEKSPQQTMPSTGAVKISS